MGAPRQASPLSLSPQEATMRKTAFAAICVGMVFIGQVVAQEDSKAEESVTLGAVTVTLGMPRAAVLAKLSSSYRLDDNGLVISKSGPPYQFLGSIGFDDHADWRSSRRIGRRPIPSPAFQQSKPYSRRSRRSCAPPQPDCTHVPARSH